MIDFLAATRPVQVPASSMGIHCRLSIAFLLCAFEYSSLSFLSLEPVRQIIARDFPFDNNTRFAPPAALRSVTSRAYVLSDFYSVQDFFQTAADQGFAFNQTVNPSFLRVLTWQGWTIAFSYCSLLILVLICYSVVYLKELGYGCFCSPSCYSRMNRHICTRIMGKSFLLLWSVSMYTAYICPMSLV